LGACTDTGIEEQGLLLGDEGNFRSDLQDYVGARCGSLDCHGDMGRALRIYAENGLRLRDDLRGTFITQAEVSLNLRSFAAFPDGERGAADNLVLLKGLDPAAGGVGHKGREVWLSVAAPGYLCIRAWLEGARAEQSCEVVRTEFYVSP
jgi:hypothetical protein